MTPTSTRRLRIALAVSIALNCVLLGAIGYVVYRRGGMAYLSRYQAILSGHDVTIDSFPIYYQQRFSQFMAEPAAPGSTILVGDSLTEEGDWAALLPELAPVNRGIGADTTVGLRFRAHEVIRSHPAVLLVMIGIADLRVGRSIPAIAESYRAVLRDVRLGTPATRVVVQSVLPIDPTRFGREIDPEDIGRLNEVLRDLASENGCEYLDLYSVFADGDGHLRTELSRDGVHLVSAGYELWAAGVRDHLRTGVE